jgi:hypothetical protein
MIRKVVISLALFVASTNLCLAESLDKQALEISFNHYHYRYSESIGDSETNWMNGIHISYKNQNTATKEYWKLSYEQTNQNTNYDGALINITTGSSSPYQGISNNKITNIEATYGVPLSKNTYAYAGIGTHKWNRNLTGSAGYLEKYSWNYIPVGYRSEYKISNKWEGALDVSVRLILDGEMETEYNGGSTYYIGNKYTLGNKIGFKAELPICYEISPKWSLVITPWYEYSGIGKSNTLADTSYEPDSITHQYGINIGFSYIF